MKDIAISNRCYETLQNTAGKIERLSRVKTTPSDVLYSILRFIREHRKEFEDWLLKTSEYGESYGKDILRMERKSLPTTRLVFRQERIDVSRDAVEDMLKIVESKMRRNLGLLETEDINNDKILSEALTIGVAFENGSLLGERKILQRLLGLKEASD